MEEARRRRLLKKALVKREITRAFIGWNVKTYFVDFDEPLTVIWFLTKRGAEKWVAKRDQM